MSIKNFIKNLLTYTPQEDYEFVLSQDSNTNKQNSNIKEPNTKVFPNVDVNVEYIKTKYNTNFFFYNKRNRKLINGK